ncbi:hypothetical protein HPB50_012852 [Hyalomma asiaticum]|uniref:Uncharacterized protein n=1 Tax=Hyalomma asiaticum TaxID=266040 RepID=A0ACB7SY83_HYAAI|nr:hypothetical protein HPB50_012852 [Hyalomma asiaticum]
MDVRKVSRIKVSRAFGMATCLGPPEAEEDIVYANDIQNILMISTPSENNAVAYSEMTKIPEGETLHQVSVYVTPSGDTCKWVVRGIDPQLFDDRLVELFVHGRNPKVLGVRRIKKTPTVIVLFSIIKVPNYVICGPTMIRCTLYRRQIDPCRICGKLGHHTLRCLPDADGQNMLELRNFVASDEPYLRTEMLYLSRGTRDDRPGVQKQVPGPPRQEKKTPMQGSQ